MTLLSDLPDGTAELFRPEFIAVDALSRRVSHGDGRRN
jgi:hypothetical protein